MCNSINGQEPAPTTDQTPHGSSLEAWNGLLMLWVLFILVWVWARSSILDRNLVRFLVGPKSALWRTVVLVPVYF